jgi:hypothetical protein
MRRGTIRLVVVCLLVLMGFGRVQADPIFPTSGSVVAELGGFHVWPFGGGGGDLRARSSDGRFLLFLFAGVDLSGNLFCRECEPARANASNVFSVMVTERPGTFDLVAIVDPLDNSEVRFVPALYDITFSGEFRMTSPLFLDAPLGERRPLTLAANIAGIERATGRPAFDFDITGLGHAEVIQTEFEGQLARGIAYRFEPVPEPATLALFGGGVALILARRRIARHRVE